VNSTIPTLAHTPHLFVRQSDEVMARLAAEGNVFGRGACAGCGRFVTSPIHLPQPRTVEAQR
jgi:hypothetical protein